VDDVLALSCAFRGPCTAVSPTSFATQTASGWDVVATASVWPDGPVTAAGVDCIGPDFCMAVADGRAARWDGTAWHRAGDLPGGTSTVQCVMVGPGNPECVAAVGRDGTVSKWDGTVWTRLPLPSYSGTPVVATATTCWAASRCVIVGREDAPGGRAWATRWDGDGDTLTEAPVPGADADPSVVVHAVGCGSGCLAVTSAGLYVRPRGDDDGPLSWTPAPAGPTAGAAIDSVACDLGCLAAGRRTVDGRPEPVVYRYVY
jgi:hypothetical protein